MGVLLTKINRRCRRSKRYRIVIVGLEGAGKKTILDKLQLGKVTVKTLSTGFHVRRLKYKNIVFTAWDLGGMLNLRFLRREYLKKPTAIVYVVDSTDEGMLELAKEELQELLRNTGVVGIPLLVMANKQDLPEALPVSRVSEVLNLTHYVGPWHLQPTCATASDGLYESCHYLFLMITLLQKPA
ncbi:ADP-ribosylation factor-like [Penaeus japonicus]|uniref:ADP-ribosylation factor-like n=1 Tax=Penaeus japonicus TaxID=27405 RepID=UPI001C7106A8|nr:ADP-ribosylation factor-like [Penaeus japonicus]